MDEIQEKLEEFHKAFHMPPKAGWSHTVTDAAWKLARALDDAAHKGPVQVQQLKGITEQ